MPANFLAKATHALALPRRAATNHCRKNNPTLTTASQRAGGACFITSGRLTQIISLGELSTKVDDQPTKVDDRLGWDLLYADASVLY